MTTETKFKVGDKVSAFGVEGEVVSINVSSEFPIKCKFVNGYATFKSDGRYYDWQEPSLKLIEERGVDFIVSSGRYKSEEDE